jgi:hypothetical protein
MVIFFYEEFLFNTFQFSIPYELYASVLSYYITRVMNLNDELNQSPKNISELILKRVRSGISRASLYF